MSWSPQFAWETYLVALLALVVPPPVLGDPLSLGLAERDVTVGVSLGGRPRPACTGIQGQCRPMVSSQPTRGVAPLDGAHVFEG
jgi:hypothetical protein